MSDTSRRLETDVSSDVSEDKVRIIPLPVHPLPEEIRKMKRDETVCRYCGVSYLIHNEIKALENKLKMVQKELKTYHGMEGEMKKLQEEMDTFKTVNQELQTRLESVTSLVGEKEHEINSWICHEKELERQLQTATKSLNSYKSKRHRILEQIQKLVQEVESHRELLTALQVDAQAVRSTWMDESEQLFTRLTDLCNKPLNENLALKSAIDNLQDKNTALQSHIENLESSLNEKEEAIKRFKVAETRTKELEDNCKNLQAQAADASMNHTNVVKKNHELERQNEDAKEQIRKLNAELELLQLQLKHHQNESEQTLTSLREELRNKETLMSSSEKELQDLKNKFSHYQKNEEEFSRRESVFAGRTEELQKSLERAKCDIEALKNEQEMMVDAHQDQIEQLQSSFQKKLADADLWPQKMEEALKIEKEKQENELNLLEKKLRENFVTEMQTEKQKHQQIMDDYTLAAKDKENKLKNQLNMAASKNKAELLKLEAQMAECKVQFREKESGLQQETASLKKIIQELELRLARVDNSTEEEVKQLQTQLMVIQNHLLQVESERSKMESQLISAREEIIFLYDTVRRECEERNELTESLSQTREELLAYKRLGRGYSAQQNSSGNRANNLSRNAHSSASVPSSLGQSTLTSGPCTSQPLTSRPLSSRTLNLGPSGDVLRRGSTVLQPLTVSKTEFLRSETQSIPSSKVMSPNGILLDYKGGRAQSPGRMKGSSAMDGKKRLTPLQGKK